MSNMDNNSISRDSSQKDYLEELSEVLSDTYHKRLIRAYKDDDPVQSMESELGKILLEVLNNEN